MIFRKAKLPHTTADLDARDRRRRGSPPDEPPPAPPGGRHVAEAPPDAYPAEAAEAVGTTGRGPYDVDEIEPGGPSSAGRVDLGGLLVRPLAGMELRLQVDEASQTVVAALLVRGDAALELRAFAAPRGGGLWDDIRREIAAETTRRGGTVTEGRGPFGAELKVVVPTRGADGSQTQQVSRIVGVDGPRWFLRGTLVGNAATEAAAAEPLLAALAEVVVVRGKAPMAPRDMIPLQLPDAARPAVPPGEPGQPGQPGGP